MTLASIRRTWPAKAGCVAMLVAVVLAAAAVAVSLAVRGFFDRPGIPDDELLAKKAGLTQYELREATRDGSLTGEEIKQAATDGTWKMTRDHTAIHVVVAYAGTAKKPSACYLFTLAEPLDPLNSVARAPLDQCPSDLTPP